MTGSNWPAGFAAAVHAVLVRHRPPSETDAALEQLSTELVAALEQGELSLPLTAERRAVARSSGWLTGEAAPLMVEGERIGWRRWLTAMQAVVDQLLERASRPVPVSRSGAVPDLPRGLNHEQRQAVLAPDHLSVVLLSGGPGTGKTSTVVEMLQRARARHPDLRIGLAAPTGKASRRLADAVRPRCPDLPCSTLHRWLEASSAGFRRNRSRPLELDLLVIDEMSMLDLALMQSLLEALPSGCRLILVGDPAQLPPVGSGAVWHRLQDPDVRDRFGPAAVHPMHVYRNRGALAQLASRLREDGLEGFAQELDGLPPAANVLHRREPLQRLPLALRKSWPSRLERLAQLASGLEMMQEADLEEASQPLLRELEHDLVLCPRRQGRWSLEDVHRTLLGAAGVQDPWSWPVGLPVICGSNQPELGLANGDLGVKLGLGEGSCLLFRVLGADGSVVVRRLHPARLQRLEPAVALTIHRAQGSEADCVTVLWPHSLQSDPLDRHASRLLYTAITRARDTLELITPD